MNVRICHTTLGRNGFTLLEILVAIIISAILATLLVQVMGGHSWRSYRPLLVFERSMALQESVAAISSHYRKLLMEDGSPLVTLQQNIEKGDYWSGQAYAADMQSLTYCLDFDKTAPHAWHERKTADTCTQSDTVLRVTLTYEGQSLTILFSR